MKFKSIVLLLMMIFSVLMIPSCVSAHEIPVVTSESISGSLNSEVTLQYITPLVKGSSGSRSSSSSKSHKYHGDDDNDTDTDSGNSSVYLWIFIIIIVIVLVFAVWFFFLRKG
ncbi:Region of a membrane-bound protein predicted to be embedded in the membrane [Methanobacterium congolense]|uniref:Region of a membrane-bound protein predicted to be embedded in the membrane n=2 Tax=Methanobacterium congolense TaxID=118062 RepID=A0A1D3KZB3_9EURY|nr:Region of a membrane-bound protein predicted to be embedded in the membrane [Methanobacterium congolense]